MTVPVLVLMLAAMVTALAVSLRDHAAHAAAADLAEIRAEHAAAAFVASCITHEGCEPPDAGSIDACAAADTGVGHDGAGGVGPGAVEGPDSRSRRPDRRLRRRARPRTKGPCRRGPRPLLTPSAPRPVRCTRPFDTARRTRCRGPSRRAATMQDRGVTATGMVAARPGLLRWPR